MSQRGNLPSVGGVGVANLTIHNDVAGELKLRPAALQTLEYIADKNGEINWSWENIKPATREMVADLIQDGLVIEREFVTHALQLTGKLTLKLTDKGRNVVELHRKRKITASAVKPLVSTDD